MRDEREFLEEETSDWVEDELISDDQRTAILGRYPKETGRGRQAAILAVLGAVLVGVGAILFVAANWERIPRLLRVVLLVGATVGAHATGWWLREGPGDSPRVGHALYLLGVLFFGATVFLVAQMYHVSANAPYLVLVWLLGAAPMAWGVRSRPILALSIGLGALWFGLQAVEWVERVPGPFPGPHHVLLPYLAYGTMLWGLGRLHRVHERLAAVRAFDPVLRGLGAAAIAAPLYAFTFDFGGLSRSPDEAVAVVSPIVLLAALWLAVGAGALAVWLRRGADRAAWAEAAGLGALVLLAVLSYLFPATFIDAIVYNLVFAVAIVGVVLLGAHRGDALLINLGVTLFVLDVVTRYFDFFFELLDRSLFFIVGGLILLAGGWWLERQRRSLVDRAQEGSS